MRVHAIKHVEFEGCAMIEQWAAERGHKLTVSMAPTEGFPACEDVGLLIVLGGPMAADDDLANPWLLVEKHYISDCIATGTAALGICLGAQILAEVLGGKVKRNPEREIGWFPIEKTEHAAEEPLFAGWPERLVVGQWHGDTFDLPAGLEPLFSSEACENQAFVFDRRVVGLQFHIEWTESALAALVDAARDETELSGRWIMSASEIEGAAPVGIAGGRALLFELLDALVAVSELSGARALS
jgi:GMP synthase-like glutamine amidotransferase